jgi:RNA polymerase sigma-70 factor (ECF subfamily)
VCLDARSIAGRRAPLDELDERIGPEVIVHRRPVHATIAPVDELAAIVTRAKLAWPSVVVADDVFLAAIRERTDAETTADAHATDDLYLACGLVAGAPEAIAAFDRACGPAIDRALASSGASEAERADLAQVVRQRLLVAGADDSPPRIATYSARGALAAWVRVVATREAARLLPKARREVSAEDDELAALIAPDADPELGYLKRLYRHEFKQAFEAAIAALDDRQRLLLRQHTLDGLGIDQLAEFYKVHRATTARWVEAAREALLANTQKQLVERLGVSKVELASLMRLIRSQLDVSLPRLLR